jgi:hypothetical protein
VKNGRRVKRMFQGWGEAQELWDFSKPDCKRTGYIENAYHGDHDEDWLIIKENDKEVARVGVNRYCFIEWWPATAKEEA